MKNVRINRAGEPDRPYESLAPSRIDLTSPTYEVYCGNIGLVYSGSNPTVAGYVYACYCELSDDSKTKASGESVTMFRDGDIAMEHYPMRSDDVQSLG